MESLPPEAARDKAVWRHYGIKSALNFPLSAGGGQLFGALTFNTMREERPWPKEIVNRLTVVAQVFANALARKVTEKALLESLAEIERLKDRLQAESDYLKAEIKVTDAHGEVIGRSRAIRQVLSQVEQVAPTDSSVLIRGETGTGKELIAQAIHRLSPRRGHLMVKVNCAALPSALVESELFGREKGAFTGALTRQIGRFEIADGSTIFLDEIGELSLEVQAKLLRVLQEGQFERLGSPKTMKVNVRVIAATHRDLVEDLRKGRFREDLYYRLNVFPIPVPPLRERADDIPLLVWAFLEEFSTRMGKKITRVPRKTMEALQRHSWPGNVRELRNVIEHGAIVTTGDALRVPMLEDAAPAAKPVQTLADSEREHILKSLERTGWRIKGPQGAATLLGLNPSTLYSRMQKLGIPHRRQKATAGE
jgi:transcriptional regulator with GAF, ATPase, and Fis domain